MEQHESHSVRWRLAGMQLKINEVIKMGIRYGFNYHTDENISNLAMMIMQKANKLKPDYLEIDGLAHEIIKYCQQGMKYNERK